MFSNLKPGSPVHVITTDGITYSVCQTEYVRPSFSYGFGNGPLLDISVIIDGNRKEFSGVQANSDVSVSNGYVITDSKEAAIRQLNVMLQQKNDILDNMDRITKDRDDCNEILKKLNPQYAKEGQVNDTLNSLSSRVDTMQGEFADMKDSVNRILDLLTEKHKQP